jgi:glycerol kinase
LEVLEAMENDSKIKISSLRVDGGMVKNKLLMQFQTDMLNVPVICPAMIETTALGAAYAAGLAVGYWSDINDLKQNWGIAHQWNPDMHPEKRKNFRHFWKKAIEKSFAWEE